MPETRDLREIETWEDCSKAESIEQLTELQSQLLRFQQSTFKHGHRIVLVFEGADASGKGGAIKRLTQTLDPRAGLLRGCSFTAAQPWPCRPPVWPRISMLMSSRRGVPRRSNALRRCRRPKTPR